MNPAQSTTTTQRPHRRHKYRHDPISFRDSHGRECLKVPLDRYGRKYATVTVRDYQKVQEIGATGSWYLNSNHKGRSYVRVHHAGVLLMPARIITGAAQRTVVRYSNGNPLDLRPENIVLSRGKASRADVAIVALAQLRGETP